MLLLDADKFKLYNDRYGHQNGDEVLRCIADSMQQNLRRPTDVASRYGGEEFLIILPRTELQEALGIAERIRRAVMELDIDHADNAGGCVTISIGAAACHPQIGDESRALVKQADLYLYEAKRLGRNRVIAVEATA